LCPFAGGAGSPSNTIWPGPRSTSVPSGIFIHPAVWPQQTWAENWGGAVPILGGELGPHLTQCRPGRGLPLSQLPSTTLIHPAIWPQRTWAQKLGAVPLLEVGARSLSKTMLPELRPTSMPSFILIHPTVWPQYTNVTDRLDRTDNGPVGQGEPFYKRSPNKFFTCHILLQSTYWSITLYN